ncbi:MAG: hypothetical protein K8S87_06490 [Planctomycetes bacterium]|nr:hypothetical protein [Planctomycetota bacterium]
MSLELASQVLYRFEQSGKKLDEILTDASQDLPDMMKTGVKYLVNRAVTWRGTLEQIVKIYSSIRVEKIEQHLKTVIFAALAEFLFNRDKVPAKVINDALNLVQARSKRGFANALLRRIADEIALNEASDSLSRRIVGEYEFKQDIFADPAQKPAKWLSQAYSLPVWLSKKLIEIFPFSRAVEIAEASNSDVPVFLRVNEMAIETEGLGQQMLDSGFKLEKTLHAHVLRLSENKSLIDSEFFREGLIYVQDLTSVLSSDISGLELVKNPKVVDGCAAPGGKISHVYEQLEGEGSFTAVELVKSKIGMLEDNFKRLEHKIEIVNADFREFSKDAEDKFELVLLDVPCSNLGVLARNPDVRWRLKPETVESLCVLQAELLDSAVLCVAEGGYINYSTCTILREENEEQIAEFLKKHQDFEKVSEQTWFPQKKGQQGGYRAILRRN